MKKIAKRIVAKILWNQVSRLTKKSNFKVVAVAGSVGKTSTKFAIVKLLSQKFRVRSQAGNYNDLVSVPLIYFGSDLPSLFNPIAWAFVFIKNELALRKPYPYDVVVIELGTDAPGQLAKFKHFLTVDVAVLTAITPEHMEYFKDMDEVAKEELSVVEFSKVILINKDYCDQKYLKGLNNPVKFYSASTPADIYLTELKYDQFTASFVVKTRDSEFLKVSHESLVEPLLESMTGAISVAIELGLDNKEVEAGINEIKPASGRMNRLNGINGATIIDDTYNASPEAMKAALKTLYRLDAPHKIALLGNMNELGAFSPQSHKEIGELCDPKKLDIVITLGPDANRYLAPAAKGKGCKVESFDDPYSAGKFIIDNVKEGSLILAKGSQNGVFAEETVKLLLADATDADKLVRQSAYWLMRKKKAFGNQ